MKNKNIIIIFLVIILGITPIYAADQASLQETKRANLTIGQMTYEHIEYGEIEKLIEEAKSIINRDDQEAFYKWEENYYRLYCKLQFMIQLSHLRYELYTDETNYFDEYLYSVDLLGKMKTAYLSLFEEKESLSDNMTAYYKLSIERDKLVESYYGQEIGVTIDLQGEKKNIIEVLSADSLSRAEKLEYYDKWYTDYNKAAGKIFLKLVNIDNEMAKLQGYDSYAAYAYKGYERDYTVEESRKFIESVKKLIPNLLRELYQVKVDNNGLKGYTYQDEGSLLKTIEQTFISKYPALKEAYSYLNEYSLYDISARENKESGGFTVFLEAVNEPFILLNYNKPYQTVLSFIHEFGHYFSYFEIGTHQGGLDLDETYSQSLELLALPYYKDIFGSEDLGDEAGLYVIESLIQAIIDGCLYDEFLQKVYEHPVMTVEEMNELYVELAKGYGIKVDGRSWCNISHNFEMPFYYLSYSVSAVAALEIWEQSIGEQDRGIETYLDLIQAGRENGFVAALEKAGLRNPLDEEVLTRVIKDIEDYFIEDENTVAVDKENQAA